MSVTSPEKSIPVVAENDLNEQANQLSTDNPLHIENQLSSFVTELEQICLSTVEQCLSTVSPNAIDSEKCRLSDETSSVYEDYVHHVNTELDQIFTDYALSVVDSVRNNWWWGSFFLSDLERFIYSTNQHYTKLLTERLCHSFTVRFGRVFAWARQADPSNSNSQTDEAKTRRLQRKLLHRLSQLVWLSRLAKRRLRTHPLLNSLRHELLRIRQVTTAKVSSNQLNKRIPREDTRYTDQLQLCCPQEDSLADLRRVLPSSLVCSFEKLVEKLTDLLVALPDPVPGVSFGGAFDSPESKRDRVKSVVADAVLSFYNQMDASLVDLHADAPEDDAVDSVELDDSDDSSCSGDESSNSPSRKSPCLPNPASVQAALDRFDHSTRPSRKRPRPKPTSFETENITADETALSSDQLLMTDLEINKPIEDPERDILNALRAPSPAVPSPPKSEHGLPEEIEDEADIMEFPEGAVILDQLVEDIEDEGPASQDKPTEDVVEEKSSSPKLVSSPKRKSLRSLRHRRSRTPSDDDSYSEGEVLSDSEEERPSRPTDEIAKERRLSDFAERMEVDIGEEEAEELIRMVNSQFEDEEQASDIDVTEFEIMDEWEPMTAALNVLLDGKGDSHTKDEVLAEIEAMFLRSKEASTNATSAIQSAAMESVSRKLQSLVSEALMLYGEQMEQLVFGYDVPLTSELAGKAEPRAESHDLPADVQASIQRTSAAFAEHVSSVLTNLLHATPWLAEMEAKSSGRRVTKSVPIITGRRGSRFAGMLKAYQQEISKRLNVSTA